MELPAKTSPERSWCLSAAPGSPGMPRPGSVKGRTPPPLPRRSNRGTHQGPVNSMRAPVPFLPGPGAVLLGGPCCGRGRRARPGTGAAAGGRPGIVSGARVRRCCLPLWGDPKRPRNAACRQSCERLLPSRKRMPKDP